MIRYLLALFLILFPAMAEAGQPTASRERSPGGIEYTLLRVPGARKVAVTAAWASDWAYRQDANPAAPAVGTRLIFAGGAQGYRAGKAGELFADLKAGAGLVVTADHVIGELVVPREKLDKAAKIVNAHLRAPSFDDTWFRRVRDGLVRQVAVAHARPGMKAFDTVVNAILGDQPLASALSLLDPELLQRLTRKDVVAWHKASFSRSPQALVVAGDIDAKTAGKVVDAILAGLPEGKAVAKHPVRTDLSPRRILLHAADAKKSVLTLVAPVPPTRQEDVPEQVADLILVTALSRPDGPIFAAVRNRLHASYGFRAGFHLLRRENRVLFLTGEVQTGKLAEAEKAVREAYAAFRKNGVSGKPEAMKAPLLAGVRAALRSPLRLARSELQGALDGHAPGVSLKLVDAIKSLTGEQLLAHLHKAFPAEKDFIVVAVSPEKNALPGACIITRPQEAGRCH